MASFPVITSLFITLTVYLMLFNKQPFVLAASSGAVSLETTHRSRERPFMRFIPRKANQYARLKAESFGDFMDDDDLLEMNKRQASDDYGHLRFGKREDFDDYGHMRFGRSGSE